MFASALSPTASAASSPTRDPSQFREDNFQKALSVLNANDTAVDVGGAEKGGKGPKGGPKGGAKSGKKGGGPSGASCRMRGE